MLYNKIILNTRPIAQAIPLAAAIQKAGGQCLMLPSFDIIPIQIAATDNILWQTSDIWLFLSQYAVAHALPQIQTLPIIGAVGASTAKALKKAGFSVTLLPDSNYSSEGLLNLPALQQLQGKKITLFRGKSGRTLLDEIFIQRGACVHEVICYERVLSTWPQAAYTQLREIPIDLALGLSVDSLTYFFAHIDALSDRHLLEKYLDTPWLVMSDRVAKHAQKLGIKKINIVADSNIMASIMHYFDRMPSISYK